MVWRNKGALGAFAPSAPLFRLFLGSIRLQLASHQEAAELRAGRLARGDVADENVPMIGQAPETAQVDPDLASLKGQDRRTLDHLRQLDDDRFMGPAQPFGGAGALKVPGFAHRPLDSRFGGRFGLFDGFLLLGFGFEFSRRDCDRFGDKLVR